jgi:LacI family transcriptional regulator
MSDIAGELGVSTVTVSKALSGKDGVRDNLRKSIRQKAEDLGYVYNSLPIHMRRGCNYNIGILIGAKYLGETAFYWRFYLTLLDEFKKTNFLGILEIVTSEDEANCAIPAFVETHKVDGLIILGQLSDSYLKMVTVKCPRCVFLDFYSDVGGCDCVALNNFLGSYNLTKLLVAAGHKKIAFIGSTASTTSILDRYMGFCKAMLEVALPYEAAIEDRDIRGYNIEIDLALGTHTAYVCNNDQLAGNVIRQIRRKGLNIPEDISIVGFDNDSESVTGGIGVTSLEVNIRTMCDRAVTLLIRHIENMDYVPRGRLFIDGLVVEKDSIAAPRFLELEDFSKEGK